MNDAGLVAPTDLKEAYNECCTPAEPSCKSKSKWKCNVPDLPPALIFTRTWAPPFQNCPKDTTTVFNCDEAGALIAVIKALGGTPSKELTDEFDKCCPPSLDCKETQKYGPCSFNPACADPLTGTTNIIPPGIQKLNPFHRWMEWEKGVGNKPPCPYENYCPFFEACNCGDMLKIFGPCDGPLLKMFAGMWSMEAFFTKMICCPECTEGDQRACYTGPANTRNVGACKDGTETCNNNAWGACQGEVTPNPEVCGDNIDNNCNGAIDEGCPCDNQPPRPCGPQPVGACRGGMQFCVNNLWTNCQGALFPTGEMCGDNVDNDCNGQIDETCPSPWPTPVPSQRPPGQPPTGFPPSQPGLPPVGPPTVSQPGPAPATSTAATSVSSPGLGVTGPALSAVPEMCVYVQGSANNVGLSPAEFAEGVIPPGYELIDKVQVTNCDGQRVWVTRSISNIWDDVQVLSCKGDDCKTITQSETTEQMKCGDVEVGELFTPQLTNRQQYMEVEQMVSISGIGKEVTENDPSISTGLYKFQFTTRMPGLVELSRPDTRVELPANSCIGASGTPIVIKIAKRSSPMPVIVTMPVTILQNADPSTYSIYVKEGSEWFELGGAYDAASGTISVSLDDITKYLDKDNKALFLVAGLTCHALKESCVVMHDAGNDEATVLVHGVTSTIDTWWPLVKEATFNGEKYDWIGYAYPPTDTIDKAASGLNDCLSTLGKYKKVNIVAHSVGGTIALKALDQMYNEKSKYTVISNVDKVITLGMPNQGLDVRALHKFAEFLANHKMLARAFDRDSIILSEITSPDWKPIKNPNPPWVRFIAVAGTEHCDYLDWLFTDTFGEVGKAITVPEEIKQFILANDCLVTVPNAISYLGKPEACRNMFTPYAWHPKLNDRWDMRKLIMYLLNAEKAKADPKAAFDGVNQYVSWQDTCQKGKTYAIVGKKGAQALPLYCNCGNNVCETNLGEDAISCPSDCNAWAIFLCVMFENISNILLVLFAIVFTIYVVRKYALSKNPPLRAWRLALSIILMAIFIMLILIWFWCHRLPAVSWLLAIVLTLLFVGETLLGKQSSREPPKVVHGKKAQHSSHSNNEKFVHTRPPEPEKYVPDAEELAIDQKISELKKRLKNI
jgi:pimeloyl-ACP methyl ester carboxylesterase